jgi:hypothetical protein
MHYEIDYSKSVTPDSDAVKDIKNYLGKKKFTQLTADMRSCDVVQFSMLCGIAGIHGRPVKAWYDLIHGQGEYAKAYDIAKAEYDAKPKDPNHIHMLFG